MKIERSKAWWEKRFALEDDLPIGAGSLQPPEAKPEACPKVFARQRNDKKHGRTTSQAVIDFIRRTCPCVTCAAWRARA